MRVQTPPVSSANAAAVERVLAAERGAKESLRLARDEAQGVAASARARADAIRRRSDERISKAHVVIDARIEAEIVRLTKEALSADATSEDDQRRGVGGDALKRAVKRLAARMTGEDDGVGG